MSENVIYYNVDNENFSISGFYWYPSDRVFCRLPLKQLNSFSNDLQTLAWNTSGGMIRFVTDSPFVSISAELMSVCEMPNMPGSGSSGFDIYIGEAGSRKFAGLIAPSPGSVKVQGTVDSRNNIKKEWLINLPLYNGVKQLRIGVAEHASIEKPAPFKIGKPIVLYGSSITQGGCASRPGNCYSNILSRWMDIEIINLGFSGNAKAEPEMAQLIGSIEMSLFIMDYDHNATDAEFLENTHEHFFQIIRQNRPELPVVLISKPDFDVDVEKNSRRREIIHRTYLNAKAKGDNNIYFIDGETLFGQKHRDASTVDGCHPNDFGFIGMAETIYKHLNLISKGRQNNAEWCNY